MPSYMQYKRQLAALDADNSEIESWITVKGNHIPIMKGQSKEEAVKSFIEHQAGKNDLPQGTKWSPTNKKGEGTGNKSAPKKEKYNIQHGAKISDIESMINAHADKKAYKSWKEEEEHVAEKLKEEGIYAYGSQIKEAMKNVYGDAYTKERNGGGNNGGKTESKYDPEFESVRKNALANSSLYGGRYTQKSKAEAYREYKKDTESRTPAEKHAATRTILNLFHENYNNLYEGKTKHNSSLVKEFDDKMAKDPEFKAQVQAFVKERGDVLSSDREVEAYMLAYNKVKNKLEPAMHKLEQTHNKKPNVKRVDKKAWNSPASDPWYSLFE